MNFLEAVSGIGRFKRMFGIRRKMELFIWSNWKEVRSLDDFFSAAVRFS